VVLAWLVVAHAITPRSCLGNCNRMVLRVPTCSTRVCCAGDVTCEPYSNDGTVLVRPNQAFGST